MAATNMRLYVGDEDTRAHLPDAYLRLPGLQVYGSNMGGADWHRRDCKRCNKIWGQHGWLVFVGELTVVDCSEKPRAGAER